MVPFFFSINKLIISSNYNHDDLYIILGNVLFIS